MNTFGCLQKFDITYSFHTAFLLPHTRFQLDELILLLIRLTTSSGLKREWTDVQLHHC